MSGNREVEVHLTHNPKNKKPLFASNKIKTTKYSILTFLPKNLFYQFSRIANFYFLIMVLLLQFPWAPISATSALAPLCIVIGISAIREAIEDILRYRSDVHINSTIGHCFNNEVANFVGTRWDNIYVGDIILVNQDDQAPADIVILTTSEEDGAAYIDTCNLDGETNLKSRQALSCTSKVTDFQNFHAKIECDLPNNKLDEFNGTIEIDNQKHSLENKQIILRGSSLRNTKWAIGVVIYTGHESKIMMNSSAARTKRSYIERRLNMKLVSVFIFLFTISLVGAIAGLFFETRAVNSNNHWYFFRLADPRSKVRIFFVLLASHIIILNSMIPISLYVTLEIVRVFQALFTGWDADMYDPYTDTFAWPRTTTISDDLGQIEYIFSDKTGTLTQNVMKFMKCSVGGVKYGDALTGVDASISKRKVMACPSSRRSSMIFPFQSESKENLNDYQDQGPSFISSDFEEALKNIDAPENTYIKLFMWLLATCHNVIPKEDPTKPHNIDFQASSPDEGALVSAAADLGFVFVRRDHNKLTININGVNKTVELLANLEFSSQRKRSSVIIRSLEQDKIYLFCKGADDLIYQRLSPNSKYLDETRRHMMDFADSGLRTLCCAYREIEKDEFDSWFKRYQEAICSINNREEKVEEVSNEIENNLYLVGATAIEDRLQDDVADTIESLLKARIRIWVITGDKRETAINIGFSCNLLTADMFPIILDSTNEDELSVKINNVLVDEQITYSNSAEEKNIIKRFKTKHGTRKNKKKEQHASNRKYALIVSGESLVKLLSDSLVDRFLELAILCQSVICCRVSPLQKAMIVEKMRNKTGKLALAIGDGANDVGMILKADVGVGISGKEGRQAVLASDYAISQFRFLKKLLLVHGRLNFYRNVNLINYCFYKNIMMTLNQFIFSTFSSFSGNTLYDSILYMIYNLIFTSIPPIIYACADKDVPIEAMMKTPQLYDFDGKRHWIRSYHRFWLNLFMGIIHALVAFFIPYFGMTPFVNHHGYAISLSDYGTTVYCSCVVIANLKLAMMCANWTWMHHLSIWLSIFIFPIIAIIIQLMDISPGFSGCGLMLLETPSFWCSIIGSIITSLIPVIFINVIQNSMNTTNNKVSLREHKKILEINNEIRKRTSFSFSFIYNSISSRYPDRENSTGFAFSPPSLPKRNSILAEITS